MHCSDADALIARAVDGTLDPADRLALDAHARSCAGCRDTWAGQQAVAAVLRGRPVASAPPGFAARVAARVADDSGWLGIAEWRTWTLRLAPVMGAVALAVALTTSQTAASTESSADESTTDPATVLMTASGISGDALLNLTLTGTVPTGAGETDGR